MPSTHILRKGGEDSCIHWSTLNPNPQDAQGNRSWVYHKPVPVTPAHVTWHTWVRRSPMKCIDFSHTLFIEPHLQHFQSCLVYSSGVRTMRMNPTQALEGIKEAQLFARLTDSNRWQHIIYIKHVISSHAYNRFEVEPCEDKIELRKDISTSEGKYYGQSQLTLT